MGGIAKPPAYTPGTPSGIPGASYPVLGSMPVGNSQPQYSNPGMSQMRPGLAQRPFGTSGQPPLTQGANPQQLATALAQFKGMQ